MSLFKNRKILSSDTWLDLADYNFKDYGFLITDSDIDVEYDNEEIPLSNVDGCCPTPTTVNCVKITLSAKICSITKDRDTCMLGTGRNKISCDLWLPCDRQCGEFFDLEFSDECDDRFWARGKIYEPPQITNKDKRACTVEFDFTILLTKPEYYKICSENQQCYKKIITPKPFCGNGYKNADGTCKSYKSESEGQSFCRSRMSVYECLRYKDPSCNPNKCIIEYSWTACATPRISSTAPIQCLDIQNDTNWSSLSIETMNWNLIVEEYDGELVVTDGCVEVTDSQWWGIELWKWENCVSVGWSTDGELCVEWYDTYLFSS